MDGLFIESLFKFQTDLHLVPGAMNGMDAPHQRSVREIYIHRYGRVFLHAAYISMIDR
jgi:hypothetical protein